MGHQIVMHRAMKADPETRYSEQCQLAVWKQVELLQQCRPQLTNLLVTPSHIHLMQFVVYLDIYHK